jgi:hypothetical protein
MTSRAAMQVHAAMAAGYRIGILGRNRPQLRCFTLRYDDSDLFCAAWSWRRRCVF